MTILDTARELLAKLDAPRPHICETCDGDAIAAVCRALLARDAALRELVQEFDAGVGRGDGLPRAMRQARRSLADGAE